MQDVIFADKTISRQASTRVKQGRVKKIAPPDIFRKTTGQPEAIVRRILLTYWVTATNKYVQILVDTGGERHFSFDLHLESNLVSKEI